MTESVLLPVFGSAVVLDTLTVLVMIVASAKPTFAFTTRVKLLVAPVASEAAVNVIVPVPPAGTASVLVHPEGVVTETNVVPVGTASDSDRLTASLGPLLVTSIV